MKLGILLFGHLRTFEYAGQYLAENVIKHYDCDIFMHTWDEIDSTTQCWNNKTNFYASVDNDIMNQVKKIYNPKEIVIGHQNNTHDEIIEFADGSKRVSLNGMNYMFESMRTANEMRQKYEQTNNIRYDYLLVTRPDVAIYNFLDIPAVIAEAQSLNINIDNARFFAGMYGNFDTNVRLLCNRVNDTLFFAKPSVIDRYISVNSCFDKHELNKTFHNVVSVYTRNEIKAGIIPIEISFEYNKDWKYVRFKNKETKTHTVINILGIKIRVSRNKYFYKLQKHISNLTHPSKLSMQLLIEPLSIIFYFVKWLLKNKKT